MQKWVVALLLGVAVVAAVASCMATPTPVVASVPKQVISFSDGNYVTETNAVVGNNVIPPDTYYTDGRGGPSDFCMYRVTRGGVFVSGEFWKADQSVHSFTVRMGDDVMVGLGCRMFSSP